MTDRVKGFTVTLEKDMREDDFQAVLLAVQMIKGVLHVEPSIVSFEDHMVRHQVANELRQKVLEAMNATGNKLYGS